MRGNSGASIVSASPGAPTALRRIRRFNESVGPEGEAPTDAEWLAATRFAMQRPDGWRGWPASTKTRQLMETGTNANDACFEALRYMASGLTERELFFALVPSRLLQRLEEATAAIQEAVAIAVQEAPLRDVFVDPVAVARDVRGVRVRIAGAPYGGPLGRARRATDPRTARGAGSVIAFLEAARAELLDAVHAMFDVDGDPCDGSILFEAAEPNAYYIGAYRCAILQLGILFDPFADEAYDDTSLHSRIGFIIAHELAHATMHVPRYSGPYYTLLEAYEYTSTHEEALADVVALAALRKLSSFKSLNETLLHIGQLFCAYRPPGWTDYWWPSHPPGNSRVDDLYRTAIEGLGF